MIDHRPHGLGKAGLLVLLLAFGSMGIETDYLHDFMGKNPSQHGRILGGIYAIALDTLLAQINLHLV